MREILAQKLYQTRFDHLGSGEQALISAKVKEELRHNSYDAKTGTLTGSQERAQAIREQYAMVAESLRDPADIEALPAFFFWSAWAAATDRPGEKNLSYTSNWRHEPLVGNTPTTGNGMWSIALLLTQVGMGAITAHSAVEGQHFFGLPLAEILPYVTSRTIHTQLGVLWIATAWLATGLYIAPALSGKEPRFQKLGTDVLFYALLLIVAGSIACGWIGTQQRLGNDFAFWLGNQGLEYTSMGRIWQYLLFVGLLFWLLLMGRGLWPALKTPNESRGLIAMVFLSAACIGAFYASSLMWGQKSHYSMIEYWRWWLVHLWVEGFFEVFATAVIALIFTRLGLIRSSTANSAIVLETIVFLFGGILGTLHHLYFTGTPTSVIAIGAIFSALEVVPLALVGFEAYRNYQRAHSAPWLAAYRWPIYCFIAVGFWNTVGAGLLGFAINPPIALYYLQGLNMTAAHGHAALFGVYGMLGIGLLLFCLRGLSSRLAWSDALVSKAFWALNIGLAMMVFMSLLPAGIYQAWVSISEGLWYARSPEIIHSAVMTTLVWLRVPGDIVFSVGVVFLAWFALRLLSVRSGVKEAKSATAKAASS